jgi:hypothetical protein
MPRRVHITLALIFLLVLAPLARTACGIECVAGPAHAATPGAIPQQPCVRAATCCHSTGAAVCGATQAREATATLLSAGTNTSPDAPVFVVVNAESLLQNAGVLAVRSIDTSPPGRLPDNPIPLRI